MFLPGRSAGPFIATPLRQRQNPRFSFNICLGPTTNFLQASATAQADVLLIQATIAYAGGSRLGNWWIFAHFDSPIGNRALFIVKPGQLLINS